MGTKLTETIVASATCPVGKPDVVLFDSVLPGFGLRVTAGGARTFVLQYKALGKRRRVTIGRYGELTLAQARRKAEALRGAIREGRDPALERRERLRAQHAAEAEAKTRAAIEAFTVGRLIEQWTRLALPDRSASYRSYVPRALRTLLKDWLEVPVERLGRADVVRLLDEAKVKRGPIAANRLRAYACSCWSWAEKRGTVAVNPWRQVPKPSKERSRERVLTDREIRDFWHATEALDYPWRGLLRTLLLTGQRRGEVAGMTWEEVDLRAAEWRLPGTRTKNGRPHTVPLSPAMLALLAEQPRFTSGLVFEGARGTAPSGFGNVKDRLDRAMRAAAEADGRALPAWTIHDLRRTVATGLQRLGVRLEVTEAVLNHVSGSKTGIVAVYQRHQWDAEKRAALEAWARHVERVASGEADPAVVALAEARAARGR